LNDFSRKIKRGLRFLLFFLLVFAAGCLVTGFFFNRQRPPTVGELDNQYSFEYGRATEVIGRLEEELGRERELNRQLREYNNRARELTADLTDTTERNVRNLQDAVVLIGEIREKLKVLEDFYSDRNPGGGSP
jgi:hypothetical protein